MTSARGWIEVHLTTAPAELLAVMLRAIPNPEPFDKAEALAAGAVALYTQVVAGAGARDAALSLLAADALLTHAFEVQAQREPQKLSEFAARWGGRGELASVRLQ
jgi:hypothetical protein